MSLRFAAKTNFSAFIFLPSMLLTILGESVVLNFETAAVLDSKGKPSCVWGNVAEDFFTGRKYCPAIAGFSPWTWSVGWYGTFIITCAFAYYKGRGIRARCPSSPDRDSSAFCYFLDCTRARYTDRHLLAWFILVTLCFFNSIGIRLVSTSHGKDISNACVRYGDWAGHMDYCQPAGLLEPSSWRYWKTAFSSKVLELFSYCQNSQEGLSTTSEPEIVLRLDDHPFWLVHFLLRGVDGSGNCWLACQK